MNFVKIAVIGALVAALCGCGFHLRGSQSDESLASLEMHTVSVVSKEPEIRHEVQSALQDRGFRVVQSAAQYTISIIDETIEEEGSPLESSLTIKTKSLQYNLAYRVFKAGANRSFRTQNISLSTYYTDDDVGELADGAYKEQVNESSRKNATQQIVDWMVHIVNRDLQ